MNYCKSMEMMCENQVEKERLEYSNKMDSRYNLMQMMEVG